jgi:hypothetical protein
LNTNQLCMMSMGAINGTILFFLATLKYGLISILPVCFRPCTTAFI